MSMASDQSLSGSDSQSVSSKKLKTVANAVKKRAKAIVQPFKRAKLALSARSSQLSIISSRPSSDKSDPAVIDDNNDKNSVHGSMSGIEDEADPEKQLGQSLFYSI